VSSFTDWPHTKYLFCLQPWHIHSSDMWSWAIFVMAVTHWKPGIGYWNINVSVYNYVAVQRAVLSNISLLIFSPFHPPAAHHIYGEIHCFVLEIYSSLPCNFVGNASRAKRNVNIYITVFTTNYSDLCKYTLTKNKYIEHLNYCMNILSLHTASPTLIACNLNTA